MGSTSNVNRGLLLSLVSGLAAACAPLTATIGYDEPDGDTVVVPAPDAGPNTSLDAAPPLVADGGSPAQDAAEPPEDARTPIHCWHMPDVVNARNEAGIEWVREDEVIGATDKELGCLDAGLPSAPEQVAVTYVRNDGMPLLRAGRAYSASTPSAGSGPSGWLVSVNAFVADICQQTAVPTILAFNVLTPPGLCAELNPLISPQPGDAKALRLILPNQTPLPMGFMLCDAKCAELPR